MNWSNTIDKTIQRSYFLYTASVFTYHITLLCLCYSPLVLHDYPVKQLTTIFIFDTPPTVHFLLSNQQQEKMENFRVKSIWNQQSVVIWMNSTATQFNILKCVQFYRVFVSRRFLFYSIRFIWSEMVVTFSLRDNNIGRLDTILNKTRRWIFYIYDKIFIVVLSSDENEPINW